MRTCPVCSAEWSDDTRFCPNDGSTLRAASGTVNLIGTIIAGSYHIQRKLGEGGMGAVYLTSASMSRWGGRAPSK